jgi:anti-sigma factor RsiW
MEPETLHDLTPAYALDALDEVDRPKYERHLARCARCRAELAELGDTTAMLAYAVESPVPAAALRARILETARAERSNVIPMRPRILAWTGVAAAVAACAAIGLGLWSLSLSRRLDRAESSAQRVMNVLAEPGTREIAVTGDHGRLFVAPSGEAALVVARLAPAPSGHTYEAWVLEDGKPRPAGTFDADGDARVVALERPIPNDTLVMVTLEPGDGGSSPRGSRVFSAQT